MKEKIEESLCKKASEGEFQRKENTKVFPKSVLSSPSLFLKESSQKPLDKTEWHRPCWNHNEEEKNDYIGEKGHMLRLFLRKLHSFFFF